MGVYLNLYHGRIDPNVDMDDFGSEGPSLGPFDYVTTTYLYNTRAGRENNTIIYTFDIVEDMLLCNGVYYGDWSVTADPINEPTLPN